MSTLPSRQPYKRGTLKQWMVDRFGIHLANEVHMIFYMATVVGGQAHTEGHAPDVQRPGAASSRPRHHSARHLGPPHYSTAQREELSAAVRKVISIAK